MMLVCCCLQGRATQGVKAAEHGVGECQLHRLFQAQKNGALLPVALLVRLIESQLATVIVALRCDTPCAGLCSAISIGKIARQESDTQSLNLV